ncbi:MAG: hypothetical protein MZU97_01705 [Bacillus subtilis]|nr:hypothetical protein [Bacillus subtilis]
MIQADLTDISKQVLMNTYKSFPIIIEKGEGCYLWDDKGNKYLDFVSGMLPLIRLDTMIKHSLITLLGS